jgi:hypothetical protein
MQSPSMGAEQSSLLVKLELLSMVRFDREESS